MTACYVRERGLREPEDLGRPLQQGRPLSLGELNTRLKHALSHRARALAQLRLALRRPLLAE